MKPESNVSDMLLCLADTKLVLGNVCIATVFNGRSIGDFATILAMAGTSLGTARSIYRMLEEHGYDYVYLERARGREEIAATDLLDSPPRSWAELMMTIYLTEAAGRVMAQRLVGDGDRRLAALVALMSKDGAFHESFALGWLKVLAEHERQDVIDALALRVPLALRWICGGPDVLGGELTPSLDRLGAAVALAMPTIPASNPPDWDSRRRRAGVVPASLWEVVRLKDPELAK